MTTATRPLAVVTGASNGIGYEIAKQFAQSSTDLLITSTGSFPKWGVDALCDRTLDEQAVDKAVINAGDKGGGSDGLEADTAGCIYITSYKHNAILRRHPNGALETIAHDPHLLWSDTMSVATDGHLYVTANQLHRQKKYQNGRNLRQKPYSLFRIHIDVQPVLLR